MNVLLGPILGFRGCDKGIWRVSVLITSTGPAAPAFSVGKNAKRLPAPKKPIKSFPYKEKETSLWCFDIEVEQDKTSKNVEYQVAGTTFTFTVPAKNAAPRMAYASCNGFSSMKLLKNTKQPNAMWLDLNTAHEKEPYHLMLLGGDQIYSDAMWDELPRLHAWANLPIEERIKQKAGKELKNDLDVYYRELYLKRWSQPEPSAMMASIPCIMMWDDHDIIDGWGSYDAKLQSCDVYKAIFAAASEYFSLYQMQAGDTSHPLTLSEQKHFTLACRIGPVAIITLDMRSERSDSQVISLESWHTIYEWLNNLPGANAKDGVKHLFVMSSIPVVHPDFAMLEQALGLFPGRQELEDDLRDHWTSVPHRQERLRLIHRLLDFSTAKSCRVTLLSGDVHVGALGVVRSERDSDSGVEASTNVINQLTSSGMVHPAPPGMVLFFLENVVGKNMNDDRGIVSELIELPGTRNHFIGARNWLALEPGDDGRYWANWHVESERYPFTKVIHPVGFKLGAPE